MPHRLRKLLVLSVLGIVIAAAVQSIYERRDAYVLFLRGIFSPGGESSSQTEPILEFTMHVMPILRHNCIRCHGDEAVEGGLSLGGGDGIARGGKHGTVVAAGDLAGSLLWQRVAADEMPPGKPLTQAEKDVLKEWIEKGASGIPQISWEPESVVEEGDYDPSWLDHWAFRELKAPSVPSVKETGRVRNELDRFVLAQLEEAGLSWREDADRSTLIRRVCIDLTGLPPTRAEVDDFLADEADGAVDRLIEHYLQSPHYGERWGQYWLDAGGYSDSGGPLGSDFDRALAWRYRDYVVRSFNVDKPFDHFVREQIAGDELSGYRLGDAANPETLDLLIATHFLRNGPDPTEDSCGNANEFRDDRYAALDNSLRITTSALLGLTIQCAKCHDHKLEPISQRDYYRLQAVFYPAYNIENWLTPAERMVTVPLKADAEGIAARRAALTEQIDQLRSSFSQWVWENRPLGKLEFRDEFEGGSDALASSWRSIAAGRTIGLNTEKAPGAILKRGQLHMIQGNSAMQGVLATTRSFDWTPEREGEWIQVSFDLIDNKAQPDRVPTRKLAFFLGLDSAETIRPSETYAIMFESRLLGGVRAQRGYTGGLRFPTRIGTSSFVPGFNFGIRVTNIGGGRFRLEHLRDWTPEAHELIVAEEDLPDGAFGFRYHLGQSCIVDNLAIETGTKRDSAIDSQTTEGFHAAYRQRLRDLRQRILELQQLNPQEEFVIPWVTDVSRVRPEVHLLERGDNTRLGPRIEPGRFSFLSPGETTLEIHEPFPEARSTGTRLAWVNWLTSPGTRQSALLARTQVNRIWQHHFGRGLVSTPENMGVSGERPSHPELLEWLTSRFVESGWSVKGLHRLILSSSTYRQASTFDSGASEKDPLNRLLWRYPMRRLDAEAIRDGMLQVSGELNREIGGAAIPTYRLESGEIVADEQTSVGLRRSIYLHHRRAQTTTMMNVFDAPVMALNCIERKQSATALQPLALLNSQFCNMRGAKMAARLDLLSNLGREEHIRRAFVLALSREPTGAELSAALEFVEEQRGVYGNREDAAMRTWTDFCQSLLSSNAFLYLQ